MSISICKKPQTAYFRSCCFQNQTGVLPFQVQVNAQLAQAPYRILSQWCCSSGLSPDGTPHGRRKPCHCPWFWWGKSLGHYSNPGGLPAHRASCCSCTLQDRRAPWLQVPLSCHFAPVKRATHTIGEDQNPPIPLSIFIDQLYSHYKNLPLHP